MTRPDGVSATETNAQEHATRYEALRSASAEVVRILAAMAFGHIQEVHA